jgi:predicted Rdx family selenoprotein
VYEVECDGELIYSKKQTGRHAEPEAIVKAVRSKVG